MKLKFLPYFILLLTLSFVSCGGSGGGAGSPAALSISASGSVTILQKGSTLLFTANEAAVTWSVVGGSVNGSIDASGLYTPPDPLPANPHVTIRADLGSESATQSLDLRVGSTIAFSATATKLNSGSYADSFAASDFTYTGLDDQIAVGGSDLKIIATWLHSSSGPTSVETMIRQQVDLGVFSPEDNLSTAIPNYEFPVAIEFDNALNPVILLLDDSDIVSHPRLSLLKSSDGGTSFTFMNQFPDPALGHYQMYGSLSIDSSNQYHVSYLDTTSISDPVLKGKLFYTKSIDGGTSWTTPLELGTPTLDRVAPHTAVSKDGTKVYTCYTEVDLGPPVHANLYVASSNTGGTSFNPAVEIDQFYKTAFCKVAIGPSGEVYVAYHEDGNIYVAKSSDNGLTFPQKVKVSAAPIHTYDIVIGFSVDSLGRLDVVWDADLDNNGTIESLLYSRSTDGGLTFSANTPIDVSPRSFILPMGMVHDSAGRLHLLYADDKNALGTNYEVFYSKAE